MRCSACGTAIELSSGERVGFRDECAHCRADLHSCRNCAHHDPGAYNACREPGAERVSDRERANRCDWFTPAATAAQPKDDRASARSALDALFAPKRR
ncbi:MAG: hypothetical protein DCC71_14745 [Proteobacteria bacterium]|nr:MAG: hypothetical protein DCC71_14745 [Pseudomonadota bacterium]